MVYFAAAAWAVGSRAATPGDAGPASAASAPTPGGQVAAETALPTDLATLMIDEKPLSEAALRAQIARRSAELVRAAADGGAGASVTAAEFILLRQLEPPLSREILGISGAEDRRQIAERTAAALALLDDAAKKLESAKSPANAEPLRERMAMARAFAAVFAAIAAADLPAAATSPSAESADRLLKACRGLAGYVDASDPGLASSARLWQAATYRRAGRADRTLQLLPRVRMPARAMPYDFFSRLERCRALMDRGEFVAAAALSAQIGEEIEAWTPEGQRDAARRANLAMRATALRRWSEALRTAGKGQLANEVGKDAESVEAELARLPGSGLLRLEQSYGGAGAPLAESQKAARLLDLECRDPVIAVVIDASALKSDGWPELKRAIAGFIRSLGEPQSFAIVSTRGSSVVAYPDGRTAHGGKAEAVSRAEQFLTRLAAGRADRAKGSEAMLQALELKPQQVFLVASQAYDAAFMRDLAKLLRDAPARLNVIWLGSNDDGGLEKLANDSGGAFRRPAAATKPAEGEDDGGEVPAP